MTSAPGAPPQVPPLPASVTRTGGFLAHPVPCSTLCLFPHLQNGGHKNTYLPGSFEKWVVWPWLVSSWLECQPMHQKVLGSGPGEGHLLVLHI